MLYSILWRHNGHDCVSNHQPCDCLLNRLFRHRSKKTSRPRVTGLCAENSPVTGEFPAQMVSNAENVSIWWRHHVKIVNAWITCVTHSGAASATHRFQDDVMKGNSFRITVTLWGEPITLIWRFGVFLAWTVSWTNCQWFDMSWCLSHYHGHRIAGGILSNISNLNHPIIP